MNLTGKINALQNITIESKATTTCYIWENICERESLEIQIILDQIYRKVAIAS